MDKHVGWSDVVTFVIQIRQSIWYIQPLWSLMASTKSYQSDNNESSITDPKRNFHVYLMVKSSSMKNMKEDVRNIIP